MFGIIYSNVHKYWNSLLCTINVFENMLYENVLHGRERARSVSSLEKLHFNHKIKNIKQDIWIVKWYIGHSFFLEKDSLWFLWLDTNIWSALRFDPVIPTNDDHARVCPTIFYFNLSSNDLMDKRMSPN